MLFIDLPFRPRVGPCGVLRNIIMSAILFVLFEVATSFSKDYTCQVAPVAFTPLVILHYVYFAFYPHPRKIRFW